MRGFVSSPFLFFSFFVFGWLVGGGAFCILGMCTGGREEFEGE